MSNRERVLFKLAKQDKSDVTAALRAITECAASALDIERVGIWRLRGSDLVAIDVFSRSDASHRSGDTLLVEEYPSYLKALRESRTIAAHDARNDHRTFELDASYLQPNGIFSMLDVPVWYPAEPGWVLCHEHVGWARRWTKGEQQFAAHLADLVALSLEAGARREAERCWDAVSNAVDEAVFLLEADGRIQTANRSARNIVELAGGGETLTERNDLVEFRDATGRVLQPEQARSIASGRALNGELIETLFKKSGERRTYRVTSTQFDNDERTVVVMADVSDEAHLERLKSELLSALAHELNTPLAVTKGYALHLARSGDMPAAAQPMLDAMVRASARMERLAADLLLLSQITFGRIVLARQETDIPTLVRAVVDTMGSPLASRIRVTESGHTIASVDPERVAHAVRRLLDNAVRFSPKGSRIDVSVRSDGDDVVVSVKDRGKGIAAQERQRLFRPFSRADDGSHKDGGGLGIGLFLAREIALHHRGSLDLESVSGVGTTFRLRLPKQEAS